MSLTSNGIDTKDPGAVPGASTTDTNALAAPEMSYAGECKSVVSLMGAK